MRAMLQALAVFGALVVTASVAAAMAQGETLADLGAHATNIDSLSAAAPEAPTVSNSARPVGADVPTVINSAPPASAAGPTVINSSSPAAGDAPRGTNTSPPAAAEAPTITNGAPAPVSKADTRKAISRLRRAYRKTVPCRDTTHCATYFDSFGAALTFNDGTIAPFVHEQRLERSDHDCIQEARAALSRGDRALAVQWAMAAYIDDPLTRNWFADHPDAVLEGLRHFGD